VSHGALRHAHGRPGGARAGRRSEGGLSGDGARSSGPHRVGRNGWEHYQENGSTRSSAARSFNLLIHDVESDAKPTPTGTRCVRENVGASWRAHRRRGAPTGRERSWQSIHPGVAFGVRRTGSGGVTLVAEKNDPVTFKEIVYEDASRTRGAFGRGYGRSSEPFRHGLLPRSGRCAWRRRRAPDAGVAYRACGVSG